MKLNTLLMALVICTLTLSEVAFGKTLRATEMDAAAWAAITSPGTEEVTIEFRQGDQLPVSLTAEGDLLETTQASTGVMGVKQTFWLKIGKRGIEISFDNTKFKPLNEAVSGSFQAGAGGDPNGGIANVISLTLKAYLK